MVFAELKILARDTREAERISVAFTSTQQRDNPMIPSIQASARWYETAFGPLTAEFWHALADPAQTARETDFIASNLAAPKRARLVDLACGDGRHARGSPHTASA